MRTRILTVLLLLAATCGYAQYFNHHVGNYAFECVSTQTITSDPKGNIVLFSIDQSINTKDIHLLKVDEQGKYKLAKRILIDTTDTLIPQSIIRTYDTGYVIIGTYIGNRPSKYPVTSSRIHTGFFAKYDKNLNRVWFKLLWGYPYNDLTVNNPAIDAQSIVAVPNSTNEDYYMLNYCTGVQHSFNFNELSVTKIDVTGNVVVAARTAMNVGLVINNWENNIISYLPANNILTVTGSLADNTIPGGPNEVFYFTSNLALTSFSNMIRYHMPVSPYGSLWVSDVIEGQGNTNNAYLSFLTDYTFSGPTSCNPFGAVHTLMYAKFPVANPAAPAFTGYVPNCLNYIRPPITIKNVVNTDEAAIGFAEGFYTPGGAPFCPALLRVDTFGNVLSFHKYNQGDSLHYLPSFNNYLADSFILHTSTVDYYAPPTFIRIIKTDVNGGTYCNDTEGVMHERINVDVIDTNLIRNNDSVLSFAITPADSIVTFSPDSCDSVFFALAKYPTGVSHPDNKYAISIYPNPAYDKINIMDEGDNVINRVRIINTFGQLVSERQFNSKRITYDISDMQPGYYFIQIIRTDQSIILARPFVKM